MRQGKGKLPRGRERTKQATEWWAEGKTRKKFRKSKPGQQSEDSNHEPRADQDQEAVGLGQEGAA